MLTKTFSLFIHFFFLISLIMAPICQSVASERFSFSLGGGYERFSSKRHMDNTGVTWGAVAYELTSRWGFEGLLGFLNTQSRQADEDGRQVKGTLFELAALYHFTPYHSVVPYLLAGPGMTSFNPNGNDAHTQGNVNAGLGAIILVTQAVHLRVEAREIYTMVGGKSDFMVNAGVQFPI